MEVRQYGSASWEIPAMNKYMGLLGFALMGSQAIQFRMNDKYEDYGHHGLYYKAFEDDRQVVVCTGNLGWGMHYECMTLFKIIPIKPGLVLPQKEPYSVYYYRYKLCGLYWKQSHTALKWNGEAPFLDTYVVKGSLHWSLGITEKTFSL
jgi:hypothetical protein